MRFPVAGFISQPQTTPEAMNEIDIGNRKMPRKSASPLSRWSSRIARPSPMTRQPRIKPTVNTAVLRTSITNRGSLLQQVGILLESDTGEIRQQPLPFAERDPNRPADEPINKDRHRHDGGQQQRDRQVGLVPEHRHDRPARPNSKPARRSAARSRSGSFPR